MRQGQQNRRGRGRNNNNNNNNNNQSRKGQNPLTRSFESNGPDMKIRGTPAHIAEKYIAMARDAHSAGDPVLAENYLQHAEHYNRIILAYREQQLSQGGGDPGGIARPRPAQLIDNTDGEDGDEDDGGNVDPGEAPQPVIGGSEGQPQPQQQRNFDQPRFERPHRQDRQDRGDRGDRPDYQQRHNRDRHDRNDRNERNDRRFERGPRQDRGERFGGDNAERNQGGEHREGREFREPREPREPREHRDFREPREPREPRPFPGERNAQTERPQLDRPERSERAPPVEANAEAAADTGARADQPRRRERFAGSAHEQPEFLRRPVRRPRRETNGDAPDAPPAPAAAGTDEPGRE